MALEQARAVLSSATVATEQAQAALSKAIATGQRLQNTHGPFCEDEIKTARAVLVDQTTQSGRDRKTSKVVAAQQVAHWKARRKANAERKKKRALTVQKSAILTPTEHTQVEALDKIIAVAKRLKNKFAHMGTERKEFGLCAIESISESIRSLLPLPDTNEDEDGNMLSQAAMEENEEWAIGRMQASLEDAETWMEGRS